MPRRKNGAISATIEETAEVLRLDDRQRIRLTLYVEQLNRAQMAFNEAFTNILIGRGVDLEKFSARLSDDGAVALLRPRGPATP